MTSLTRRMVALGTVALAATLAACTQTNEPQPEPDAIAPALGEGWQLVWNDEFDGDAIDFSKWSHETNCWGGGNNELQCYTDRSDNSFIRDGKLVIHAQEEEFTGPAEPLEWGGSPGDATLPYTSARLSSKDKGDWTYGRFEIRAKIPGGQGVWPAIWMMPTDSVYGSWAASGEIDIMEAVNLGTEPSFLTHGTLHYGGVWPGNQYSGTSTVHASDPTQDFHTYAIEWAHGEIRWYVDDLHFATQTSEGWYSEPVNAKTGETVVLVDGQPFDRDFHLLLNVAIGGNWPGSPDATTQLPVEMEVDFVRIWSCPASPETLETCGTVNPMAEHVKGSQPVTRDNIDFDPEFINQDVVTVFDDGVQGPYYIGTWTGGGSIDVGEAQDEERGTVAQFTFDTDNAVAYFQSVDGWDFSDFTSLEFDLKVLADPRPSGGYMMKIDSFHPLSTGDTSIGNVAPGEWTHFSLSLADLASQEGSTLDLTHINTPLVIFPDINNQKGVVMLVDNVRMVR